MLDPDPLEAIEATVTADGLAAGYGADPVIEEVSFALWPGQRVGVLGPNGGGKTTLFRILLGELRPLRGLVEVRSSCGYVPQTERSRLDYPVSALDVALMGTLTRVPWWRRIGHAEKAKAHYALGEVGLGNFARRQFGELSGGQRQRVLVARALVQDAQVLLLDEPFAGVDERSVEGLMTLVDRLAGEGRTVLIATHDVEQASSWDVVLCLNRRQVAFGPPAGVLTLPVLEATYGGSIVMLPTEHRPGDAPRAGILPPHHHHKGH
jgi:ABC-type Mn2+/Zn2+ transport system ATPase subunit